MSTSAISPEMAGRVSSHGSLRERKRRISVENLQSTLESRRPTPDRKNEIENPKPLDANSYATKKTIAQGMLDIALLTANASQLKYVLQVGHQHEFYTLMVWLISISIVLQVVSGILMIVLGAMDINEPSKQILAAKLNHAALGFIMGSMVSDVVKMSFGLDAGPRRNGTAACQGVIYVMLGSTLNINKDKHQPKANIWNNTVLAMGIITTVINVVISAFDMRDTDKTMIFNTTTAATPTPK